MARDLKLEVLLSAVDKITAPLRNITRGSSATAQAMKASRDQLKQLQAQQRDVGSFKVLQQELSDNGRAMAEMQAKSAAVQGALDRHRTSQQSLAAEVKVHRAEARRLHDAMTRLEQPSAELNRQYLLAKDRLQQMETAYGKSNSQLRQLQRELKESGAATATLGAKGESLSGRLDAMRARLQSAGISTDRLGDEEVSLTSRIEEANRALAKQAEVLKRTTQQQERLAQAKEQYERLQGVAGSMSASGAAGLATGTGILYAGARMIAPSIAAQQQGSMIAAQGGESTEQAKQYAAIIRGIRADGLSDDMAAIGTAVAAVRSTLGNLGEAGLDRASRKAMDLSAVLGGDVAEHVQTVGILLQNKLAGSSDEAFDLLTAGLQQVSTQMRGELPEILHEYSTHFRGMGYTGAEAMGLLVTMAKQGKFALDKTGDAIKEFSIRGSDMSKASVGAYEALGFNAAKMSTAVASGGDEAKQALQQTAKALLEIEDPAERANTAIALFGTPVEDLAIDQIPAFLQAMAGAGEGIGDVAGKSAALGKTLRDNLGGDVQALGGAWSELNSTLADSQAGPLRQVTQGITRLLGNVRAWAQANPVLASGLVKLALGFGLLVAAGGAVTLMLASMLGPFALVRYGMAMFGIKALPLLGLLPKLGLAIKAVGTALWALAANPVVLVIAGIAAAIAGAAYLIWSNWGTLGPKFAAVWESIKSGFSGVMGWFAGMPQQFTQFGANILQGLVTGITSKLGAVKEAIMGAGDAVTGWFKEKLGIHSPSRVFAELGGWTMAGLDQGLTAAQDGPLKTVAQTAKQLTAAGTVALGAGMAMPALADIPNAPAFDTRPALSAAPMAPGSSGGGMVVQGDTINITIQAAPGSDTVALRQMIEQLLQERERGKAARLRSALHDRE